MLPASYRKLIAARLSRDFKAAVEIVEAPLTEPGPGEVVIRTLYAGLNASVGIFTAGGYPNTPPVPFDVKTETAGEVVAVGADVTNLKPGDQVVSMEGGFLEYQTLKARRLIPVPKASPEATSFLTSGLTASISLEAVGEMKSGETVLVTAAAGGTGQFAVQLAKLAGNHVIGTVGSDDKVAMLKEMGCDRVINYRTEDLAQVLKAEYPNGVNIVYESVGGTTFDTAVKNLAIFGRLIIIGNISEYIAGPEKVTQPRIYNYLLGKSASVRGFFLLHYGRQFQPHLGKLNKLYEEGKLQVKIDPAEFKGLDSVVQAFEHLHSGKSTGKVIVSF